jgi:hypothetical protein
MPLIHAGNPNKQERKTMKIHFKKAKPTKTNPIADAYPVSGISAYDINVLMQAARKFPQLQAYDSPCGEHILIATEQPTPRQIGSFFKRLDSQVEALFANTL